MRNTLQIFKSFLIFLSSKLDFKLYFDILFSGKPITHILLKRERLRIPKGLVKKLETWTREGTFLPLLVQRAMKGTKKMEK